MAILAALGAIACRDDEPVGPRSTTPTPSFVISPGTGNECVFDQVRSFDGEGFARGADPATSCNTFGRIDPWTPIYFNPDVSIAWISDDPDDLMPRQPGPVTFTFHRPILNPVVVTSGEMACSGDPGQVTVHTISEETKTVSLRVANPADCGLDNKTNGYISDPITTSDPIRFIEIQPPTALQWHFEYTITVCDDDGSNCHNVTISGDPYAHISYGVYFRETPDEETLTLEVSCDPQVARRAEVTCRGSVVPSHSFTLVRKEAEAEGHTYVDNTPEEHGKGEEVRWSGTAIVDTRVTMVVQVNTPTGVRELSDDASFTVTPQTWAALVMPPRPHPTLGSDVELPYPPAQEKNGKDQIPDGALGKMILDYGVVNRVSVFGGPNRNWYYVQTPVSLAEARIITNRALEPTDPFFQAQHGPPAGQVFGVIYCRPADMRSLKQQVVTHENAHYDAYLTYFGQHDVAAQFERLHLYVDVAAIGQPGAPSLEDSWKQYENAEVHDAIQAFHKATVDNKPAFVQCKFRYPGGP